MIEKKKKNTAGKVFLSVFLKTMVCISSLCLAGGISYKATMLYYEYFAEVEENESLTQYIEELNSDGKVEEVSKNLILSVNEETGRIKKILIEILNSETGNLDYITVPNSLEFTMSYDLYKKLASANGDVPQIISVKKIHKYFQGESIYQCAQLLLEDVLDISFSYYTAIPSGVFDDMFRTKKGTGIQVWRKPFQEQMKAISTVEGYQEFFHKYYEKVQSNLAENNKCTYASAYLKGGPNQVAFHKVSGEKSGNAFVLSVEESNSLVNNILNEKAYTKKEYAQNEIGETESSSVGLDIEILNSTNINGLASSYQEKLIEQGMHVVRIGNYENETLEQTKILVKEEGMGQDLLSYFKDADIEVSQLESDMDISIIIGSQDGDMSE